jgi:hypothetical protein
MNVESLVKNNESKQCSKQTSAKNTTSRIHRTRQANNTAAANMNRQVLLLQAAAFVLLCCMLRSCRKNAVAGAVPHSARNL